jgi:hypothetical protein
MVFDPLRQLICGLLLLMMGAVLCATVWAEELETRVRLGLPPPPSVVQLLHAGSSVAR